MNGETTPATNKGIIFVVIITVAACTVIGVITFACSMLFGVVVAVIEVVNHHELPPIDQLKPEAVIVTAFSSIVTACLGYLAGVLSKTSPTEATKHVDVSTAPVITDTETPPPVTTP